MVPVRAPTVIGWVLMGFQINQGLADDLYRVSGVHLAVFSGAQATELGLVVTTLAGSMAGDTGSSDGTGSDARFNSPAGVAVDVDVSIMGGGDVTIARATGAVSRSVAGSGDIRIGS